MRRTQVGSPQHGARMAANRIGSVVGEIFFMFFFLLNQIGKEKI